MCNYSSTLSRTYKQWLYIGQSFSRHPFGVKLCLLKRNNGIVLHYPIKYQCYHSFYAVTPGSRPKMTQKPQVVFVLGGPGAGKGTVCSQIVEEYGFVHLSAGDLLREERKKEGSQYGEIIENHIVNGQIVPVEITCALIQKAMEKSNMTKFLIDGFPRNEDNIQGWRRMIGDNAEVLFVLFLDCSEEVCTERCLRRGAAGSGRSDDNLESLKKRFKTYMNDTMGIIKHFEEENMVRKVDGSRCKAEVLEDVRKLFNGL